MLMCEQFSVLSSEVGPDRTLLVCCGAFRAKRDEFANLTLKKIPLAVLHRCEWGKDDYSLNINERVQPAEDRDGDATPSSARGARKAGKKGSADTSTLSLFREPEPERRVRKRTTKRR